MSPGRRDQTERPVRLVGEIALVPVPTMSTGTRLAAETASRARAPR